MNAAQLMQRVAQAYKRTAPPTGQAAASGCSCAGSIKEEHPDHGMCAQLGLVWVSWDRRHAAAPSEESCRPHVHASQHGPSVQQWLHSQAPSSQTTPQALPSAWQWGGAATKKSFTNPGHRVSQHTRNPRERSVHVAFVLPGCCCRQIVIKPNSPLLPIISLRPI